MSNNSEDMVSKGQWHQYLWGCKLQARGFTVTELWVFGPVTVLANNVYQCISSGSNETTHPKSTCKKTEAWWLRHTSGKQTPRILEYPRIIKQADCRWMVQHPWIDATCKDTTSLGLSCWQQKGKFPKTAQIAAVWWTISGSPTPPPKKMQTRDLRCGFVKLGLRYQEKSWWFIMSPFSYRLLPSSWWLCWGRKSPELSQLYRQRGSHATVKLPEPEG